MLQRSDAFERLRRPSEEEAHAEHWATQSEPEPIPEGPPQLPQSYRPVERRKFLKKELLYRLTYAEARDWCLAHRRQLNPLPLPEAIEHRIRQWFDLVDDDGSGALDASELEFALKASGIPANTSAIMEIIKLFDFDKDGEIAWREFHHFLCYEVMADKNPLGAEYVLPSGMSLPISSMIGAIRRRKLMQDVEQGGGARDHWVNEGPEFLRFLLESEAYTFDQADTSKELLRRILNYKPTPSKAADLEAVAEHRNRIEKLKRRLLRSNTNRPGSAAASRPGSPGSRGLHRHSSNSRPGTSDGGGLRFGGVTDDGGMTSDGGGLSDGGDWHGQVLRRNVNRSQVRFAMAAIAAAEASLAAEAAAEAAAARRRRGGDGAAADPDVTFLTSVPEASREWNDGGDADVDGSSSDGGDGGGDGPLAASAAAREAAARVDAMRRVEEVLDMHHHKTRTPRPRPWPQSVSLSSLRATATPREPVLDTLEAATAPPPPPARSLASRGGGGGGGGGRNSSYEDLSAAALAGGGGVVTTGPSGPSGSEGEGSSDDEAAWDADLTAPPTDGGGAAGGGGGGATSRHKGPTAPSPLPAVPRLAMHLLPRTLSTAGPYSARLAQSARLTPSACASVAGSLSSRAATPGDRTSPNGTGQVGSAAAAAAAAAEPGPADFAAEPSGPATTAGGLAAFVRSAGPSRHASFLRSGGSSRLAASGPASGPQPPMSFPAVPSPPPPQPPRLGTGRAEAAAAAADIRRSAWNAPGATNGGWPQAPPPAPNPLASVASFATVSAGGGLSSPPSAWAPPPDPDALRPATAAAAAAANLVSAGLSSSGSGTVRLVSATGFGTPLRVGDGCTTPRGHSSQGLRPTPAPGHAGPASSAARVSTATGQHLDHGVEVVPMDWWGGGGGGGGHSGAPSPRPGTSQAPRPGTSAAGARPGQRAASWSTTNAPGGLTSGPGQGGMMASPRGGGGGAGGGSTDRRRSVEVETRGGVGWGGGPPAAMHPPGASREGSMTSPSIRGRLMRSCLASSLRASSPAMVAAAATAAAAAAAAAGGGEGVSPASTTGGGTGSGAAHSFSGSSAASGGGGFTPPRKRHTGPIFGANVVAKPPPPEPPPAMQPPPAAPAWPQHKRAPGLGPGRPELSPRPATAAGGNGTTGGKGAWPWPWRDAVALPPGGGSAKARTEAGAWAAGEDGAAPPRSAASAVGRLKASWLNK
ncbi:hypothetical protein HYH03_016775 [Edaphochlamys debaryana]|uniref:EF-hand domain-containing protein n=1 Tax=Edaphochlamys debaryana TaxID=47281 RepID=A0A835XLC1_9CHLO|nr:hypothetical protein HYH03_016775 [Edaphochlamys debaryana]|eukprot:KAG2484356.1 hypothetical protein HYH03_016775 [Edaphochlamys debaryana]